MVAGGLLHFDWTVAIMLFWLLASLFFFSISAQTCIKRKKSHGGVNDVRFGSQADIEATSRYSPQSAAFRGGVMAFAATQSNLLRVDNKASFCLPTRRGRTWQKSQG
jgi:hypothetical protein